MLYLLYSLLPDWQSVPTLIGVGVTAFTAYLTVEWNNSFALIRVRSRMCSVVFLMLTGAAPFMHKWDTNMVVTLCVLVNFMFMFRTYQKQRPEADFFHGFAVLSFGSLFFPQLLFFVPFYYISALVQLRSMSFRGFFAGLLGLTLPYWCYGGYAVWNNRLDLVTEQFASLIRLLKPDYTPLTVGETALAAFTIFYALLAAFHYARTAYNDKMRTRMFFNTLVLQMFVAIGLLVAQPQHIHSCLHILIITSTPLIAHYLTLARGRGFNFWFILTLLFYCGLAAVIYLYGSLPVLQLYTNVCQLISQL